MVLVTLTSDLLTLKLVCEWHQRWRTFIPNLFTLGLFELFGMNADGRTDGQKQHLMPPSLRAGAYRVADAYDCKQYLEVKRCQTRRQDRTSKITT